MCTMRGALFSGAMIVEDDILHLMCLQKVVGTYVHLFVELQRLGLMPNEIIASIASVNGGVKVEKKNEMTKLNKEGEVSNKASEPKSIKMKGVMNSQQTNINGKDSSKNKNKAGIVKLQ